MIIILLPCPQIIWAQQKDSLHKKKDTTSILVNSNQPKKNSLPKKDTLKKDSFTTQKNLPKPPDTGAITSNPIEKKVVDSIIKKDSALLLDSNHFKKNNSKNQVEWVLQRQRYFNVHQPSIYLLEQERNFQGKETVFYVMCFLVLILGVFKTFFSNYFKNLFRIFFNTSLRTSQITEQLLQAQLPSLILNLFFIITAGMYVAFLFSHHEVSQLKVHETILPFAILFIAVIYSIKYCVLKFIGWLGGIQEVTNNYIFIIFLINKVTGILLLPFIILFSFTKNEWINPIITLSYLMITFLLITRYLKGFGSIERKVSINRFHFLLYLIGAEVLPILILYKITVDYLL